MPKKKEKMVIDWPVKTVDVSVEGLTVLSYSREFDTERGQTESANVHDERCWKERMHENENGELIAPPIWFKKAMTSAAQFNQTTIPGKGKTQFTKFLRAGIFVDGDCVVKKDGKPVLADDVRGVVRKVPPDGKVGGGSRVPRRFPEVLPPWTVDFRIIVLDPTLVEHIDQVLWFLTYAGKILGVGRYRPNSSSAGDYGRFLVTKHEIGDYKKAA
jgi:hypothetical protein